MTKQRVGVAAGLRPGSATTAADGLVDGEQRLVLGLAGLVHLGLGDVHPVAHPPRHGAKRLVQSGRPIGRKRAGEGADVAGRRQVGKSACRTGARYRNNGSSAGVVQDEVDGTSRQDVGGAVRGAYAVRRAVAEAVGVVGPVVAHERCEACPIPAGTYPGGACAPK